MDDRFEQRRMRPLDVIEHDGERSVDAQMLEELAESPGELFLRQRDRHEAHRRSDPLHDRIGVCSATAQRRELPERQIMWVGFADHGQLPHDLRERPVGDPLPIGKASTLADPGANSDP